MLATALLSIAGLTIIKFSLKRLPLKDLYNVPLCLQKIAIRTILDHKT